MTTLTMHYEGLPIRGITFQGDDLPALTEERLAEIGREVSRELAPRWTRTPRTVSETGPEHALGVAS